MNHLNSLVPVDGEFYGYVPDGKGGYLLQKVKPAMAPQFEEPGPSNLAIAGPSGVGVKRTLNLEQQDEESPENKKKRAVWTDREVSKLLDICVEEKIVNKLDGHCGRLPHDKIYKHVARRLNESAVGEPKTWEQVSYKYGHLKKSLTAVKKHNSTSGEDRMVISHQEKLLDLFGERPNVTVPEEFGYDSSSQLSHQDQDQLLEQENNDPAGGSQSNGSNKNKNNKKSTTKYRSGNKNAIVTYLQTLREQDEKQMEEFQTRMENQLTAMQAADAAALNAVATNLMEGLKGIAAMFQQPAAPLVSPIATSTPIRPLVSSSALNRSVSNPQPLVIIGRNSQKTVRLQLPFARVNGGKDDGMNDRDNNDQN